MLRSIWPQNRFGPFCALSGVVTLSTRYGAHLFHTLLLTQERMKSLAASLIALFLLDLASAGAQTAKPLIGPTSEPHPSRAAQPTSAPTAVDGNYVIGADDVLQITVWKEASMSGSLPVRPDGMISMVLIGDLSAAGKTPMQLAGDIESRLKKYVQDPNVTVVVSAVNSHRVFVVGEVQHVGPITLSAGMTALQAIAAAGGLTPYANQKHIYILRRVKGQQQKVLFNYKGAIRGDSMGPDLETGDTIVVP